MKMKIGSILLAGIAAVILGGCETARTGTPPPTYEQAASDKFTPANYAAVDAMLGSAKIPLDKNLPIVVATLVNVDVLSESSRFGRIVSEQIGAHLAKLGYSVVELKLRGNIFVSQREGELLLSREVKDITLSHKAQAVVVGTYSEAQSFAYVNLKIVGVNSNVIVAAHDYALPIDGDVRALLNARNRGATR